MANTDLENIILQSLFKVNAPNLRPDTIFDPEGVGYDYDTALQYGMTPGTDKHWGSRVQLNDLIAQSLGYPEGTGIMLKGAGHPTWNKALTGEEQAGFNVVKGADGRYYSVPK